MEPYKQAVAFTVVSLGALIILTVTVIPAAMLSVNTNSCIYYTESSCSVCGCKWDGVKCDADDGCIDYSGLYIAAAPIGLVTIFFVIGCIISLCLWPWQRKKDSVLNTIPQSHAISQMHVF